MLSRITFRVGSSPAKSPLSFPLSPVTVFVGPNNSGKSRALIEIEAWVTKTHSPDGRIVSGIEFVPWERTDFEQQLQRIIASPNQNETINPDHVLLSKLRPQDNSAARFQLPREPLVNEAANPNAKYRHYYSAYLSLFTLRLDGRSRLSLTDDKPTGDLLGEAPNQLAKLFKDDASRAEVRRIVHEAFGKYLVIDPTNVGTLRLRLSNEPPSGCSAGAGMGCTRTRIS
jgi:hypothetical protein